MDSKRVARFVFTFAVLAVAGLIAAVPVAQAGQVTLKLATSQPPKGGFLGDTPKVFADEVEKLTKGQVKVQVFHSGSLSSNEAELFQMAQSGAVDLAIGATTYILGWTPRAKVFDLPYLFEGAPHFKKVVQGKVGEVIAKEVEDDGVYLITYILPGVRSIFSTKRSIEKIEDAKGMKIRSMQSPVYIDMFKNMGMLPTALPASELYTSLQTGVVDAGENDAASVVSWGWVDVIKFYSLNEHSISCNVMIVNKKKMDSLPADAQKAVREAGKKAENYQLDYIQKALAENLEKIKAKGVKVTVITDKKPFQDAVKDIIAKYEPEIGKDLIQAVRDAK